VIENEKFTLETQEREIKPFTATVAELGFPDGAKVRDVYAELDKHGFGICPHETALQIGRSDPFPSGNRLLIVVAEPLVGADGGLLILFLRWSTPEPLDTPWYTRSPHT